MAKAPKIIPAEEPVVESRPLTIAEQTLIEMEAGKAALARRIASHHAELTYSGGNAAPPIEELIKTYTADSNLDKTALDDLLGKL